MTATCPSCGAEQSQALLCHSCVTILERELGDVRALMTELDVTASKQARIGGGGTGGFRKGETKHEGMIVNFGAVAVADDLTNTLTTWARDVAGSRGGKYWHLVRPADYAAGYLLMEIDAIRRHPAAAELLDEITDAVQQARRAVDRPADKMYLGQCYMETPDEDGRKITCLNELYGRPNQAEVRCNVCSAEHPVGERRAWLLTRAADMLVTVKEASSYLGEVGGIRVTESSIRGYLHRGVRLSYRAPVEAKRFRLGDLLEVVMDESERKSA